MKSQIQANPNTLKNSGTEGDHDAPTCSVSFSGGVAELSVGDKFEIEYVEPYGPNGLYEIAEFEKSNRTYSPSGFGGTITIIGRHVESGKTVEFCGDSVAGAVVRYRKTQNAQAHRPGQ